MGQIVRGAAVQASSITLNTEATTAKASDLILEARA
jgi:hypothetical protein